jgi:GTPase SAR1 family protein
MDNDGVNNKLTLGSQDLETLNIVVVGDTGVGKTNLL